MTSHFRTHFLSREMAEGFFPSSPKKLQSPEFFEPKRPSFSGLDGRSLSRDTSFFFDGRLVSHDLSKMASARLVAAVLLLLSGSCRLSSGSAAEPVPLVIWHGMGEFAGTGPDSGGFVPQLGRLKVVSHCIPLVSHPPSCNLAVAPVRHAGVVGSSQVLARPVSSLAQRCLAAALQSDRNFLPLPGDPARDRRAWNLLHAQRTHFCGAAASP